MQAFRHALAALLAAAVSSPALAQPLETTPVASTEVAAAIVDPIAPAAPATVRIPAGTVVHVELTEALSSETSEQQQVFGLRLVEPIVIDGREIVPVGAAGGGEVIDAHPSAFGGRPGRLIVSGRYIEIGGQRARIRGMQITGAGEDRGGAALGVAVAVGIPGYLVQGGETHMPVGTRATARLAADFEMPSEPAATPIEPSAPAPQQSQ